MNERAQRVERRLEGPVLLAALLTIPSIALDQGDVASPWDTVAVVLNWTIWLVFVAEAAVMLHVADDRKRWAREHPLDIAIVLFSPPFLPATMEAARLLRLLRLLRLFKLAALTRRLLSTEGVRDAAVLSMLTVLGGGAAFAAVEKTDAHGNALSAWDGVWWAMTTVTTVGYGDITPRTNGGRAIAIAVMVVGIGFIALLTAAAAERFLRSQRAERRELEAIERRLDEVLIRLDSIDGRQR